MTSFVPQACALPTVEQPLRLAEFDGLFRTDVLEVRRLNGSGVALHLRPDATVAGRVAELAARETACCSFFTFTVRIGDGALVLEVETPPAYAAVLDSLAARAEFALGRSA